MPTVAERKSASRVNDQMRTASCTLLCMSLLIHAMFGCCWHDVHEAVASTEAEALAIDSDCHQKLCCHDHHGVTNGGDSDAPCKNHPNCHGLCHYLPVQKTTFDHSLVWVPIDLAVDLPKVCGTQLSLLLLAVGTSEFSPSPPVPLHLFHQILLI